MRPSEDGCFNLASCLFASFHFSLIMFLSCLFFSFPCAWLTVHASWAFPIICGLLYFASIILFLLASFTDTGILQKGIEEEMVNQMVTKRAPDLRWCSQCQLYSRPHTFHCSWCNACVEDFCLYDFDHHCMWVNNCVGCHNVHFFYLFEIFLSFYNLAMLTSCYAYLRLNSQRETDSVEDICTYVVFMPTLFSLLPLLIQLNTQVSYVRTAPDDLQADTSQKKVFKFCRAWSWASILHAQKEPKEKSAKPEVRTEEARVVSPASHFSRAAPSPPPHSSPPDMPGGQTLAKAWHHFRASVSSLLHWKGPLLGEPTQRGSLAEKVRKADKKKSSWPPKNTDKRKEFPTPGMVDAVLLLDEDQDTHWKGQLFVNRRAPASPTGTLLSLSDI